MKSSIPAHIMPLVVVSQFAGTSVWFAGDIALRQVGDHSAGLIATVQLGFIAGCFVFALVAMADRFPPSRVFFVSAIIAALANVSIVWTQNVSTILFLRFTTGFFLAGVYPLGMKIASDWYQKGLGKALGWLVGALVLGTALPHLLRGYDAVLSWKYILYATSLLAVTGGLLILFFVGDGPYRKKSGEFKPTLFHRIFRERDFRAAAFGYFGHMWELYAFWAFVPAILLQHHAEKLVRLNSLLSFLIIGAGAASCVIGGYIAQKIGSARVAWYSLLISGACCCLYLPALQLPAGWFVVFMFAWGMAVISDSPQFSTLVAQTAPPEFRGTALTLVTCIGFAITIGSIQLLQYFFESGPLIILLLVPGPLLGAIFTRRLISSNR